MCENSIKPASQEVAQSGAYFYLLSNIPVKFTIVIVQSRSSSKWSMLLFVINISVKFTIVIVQSRSSSKWSILLLVINIPVVASLPDILSKYSY